MTDEWVETFDRSSEGDLWSRGDYTERMPGFWEIGNGSTASVSCLTCGNVITLQPGETIPHDDPRVCAHFQAPPAAGLGG